MKICPLNQAGCKGKNCAWSVEIIGKGEQVCAIAAIAMQLLYDKSERYYPTDLTLNKEENEQ